MLSQDGWYNDTITLAYVPPTNIQLNEHYKTIKQIITY